MKRIETCRSLAECKRDHSSQKTDASMKRIETCGRYFPDPGLASCQKTDASMKRIETLRTRLIVVTGDESEDRCLDEED